MKRKFPLVSIIIDNWNGKHFLKRCFDSLLTQSYPNYEVIVIDDASEDESLKVIKSVKSKAESKGIKFLVIENLKHVGFAIANNQGIRSAKGKYLFFLNNDTQVTKNFLFPLVKCLDENDQLAAAQPKIKLFGNLNLLDEVVTYLTPWGILYHDGFKERDLGQFNQPRLTFSPKGAGFLVKKEILLKTGTFDEKFYCYFEETDLCWRMWLNGWKIIYEPESLIYHESGGMIKKRDSAFRNYFSVKNRLNSLIKNLSLPFLFLILPLHLFLLFSLTFFYIMKGKRKDGLAILRAIGWNIIQLNRTFKERMHIQKNIRKISDFILFKEMFKVPPLRYFFRFFNLYEMV